MKRFALVALLLCAGTAQAQSDRWVIIREDNQDATLVDFSTAKRTGSIVKVWILTNNKLPVDDGDGKNIGSDMHLRLYDCTERQWRSTYSAAYPLADGKGTMLRSHTPKGDWKPVVPNSVGERTFLIICGRVNASGNRMPGSQ